MSVVGKEQIVSELSGSFKESAAAFVIGYQGVKAEELKAIRRKLRPVGATLSVIKNTMASRAVEGTDAAKLADYFVGPTAVVLSPTDPVTPAKVLSDAAKNIEKLQVKGGLVDGSVVSAMDIEALAKLPSKEELLSKLLALLNAPATRLLQTINAPASQLVQLLSAYKRKLEGGEGQ